MTDKLRNALDFNKQLFNFLEGKSYAFYRFLIENRLLISVPRNNYIDLSKLVLLHNELNSNDGLWDLKNQKARWKLQRQIIRLISNYIGSIFSLVEYSRKHVIPLLKKNSDTYSRHLYLLNQFNQNYPCHKFIQDLRNYAFHNSPLNIFSEYTISIQNQGPRKDIYLQQNELQQWQGWTKESKKFLNDQPPKIYLMKILKDHFNGFISLQDNSYLHLFLVDKDRTIMFRNDMVTILKKGYDNNFYGLPFDECYIRYIDALISKAQRTTFALPKWGPTE